MENFLKGRKKLLSRGGQPSGTFASEENAHFQKVEVISNEPGKPKVELTTEQGVISSIIVTCKCGERIELKCGY